MRILLNSGLLCCLLMVSSNALAQYGLICGDPPEAGCQSQYDDFKPYDLSFQTYRAEPGTGTRHESNEFYAVILASTKAAAGNSQGCSFISEVRRDAAQKLFPHHKVFASRNACHGTVVYYEGTNNDFNFLAIYGGQTQAEAEQVLQTAKKRYPQANVRRMRVILDFYAHDSGTSARSHSQRGLCRHQGEANQKRVPSAGGCGYSLVANNVPDMSYGPYTYWPAF